MLKLSMWLLVLDVDLHHIFFFSKKDLFAKILSEFELITMWQKITFHLYNITIDWLFWDTTVYLQ